MTNNYEGINPEYAGANANLTHDVYQALYDNGLANNNGGSIVGYLPGVKEGWDEYSKRLGMNDFETNSSIDEKYKAGWRNVKALFDKYNRSGSNPNWKAPFNPTGGATPAAPGAPNSGYEDQLKQFAALMMNPNAPELQAAQTQAQGLKSTVGANRGLNGGLSDMGIAKAGMDARAGTYAQRAGLGLQALSGAANHSLGLGAQGLTARGQDMNFQGQQFDQNQSNQINKANSDRALMEAIVSAGGKATETGLQIFKDSQRNSGGGNPYPAGQNAPPQYPGSSPSDWSNPYPPSY